MCSLLCHSSVILGKRSLQKRICAVMIFCPKICRHKLVVSTSFWSWLLNVSSVLTSLKFTDPLFWVFNALWFFDGSWEFWVFDFGFFVSEKCLFCVHP